ncbi:MAG: DinB family protein [Bacteroidota bacterium]
MEQAENTIERLTQRAQVQARDLNVILGAHLQSQVDSQPIPNKWSFNEQLVHLTRYARHFTQRIKAMQEGTILLPRYVENEDDSWREECLLPVDTILSNYWVVRQAVISQLSIRHNWNFGAKHPKLGYLMFLEWMEFFLQHEGHHVYTLFKMSKIQNKADG